MKSLTPAQAAAIAARGNVLLEAGAGAGKTSTLVARCLALALSETNPISLDEVLMVTFTEAAAAEMRRRIREALNSRVSLAPGNARLAEQVALLEQARIGTLHSFCLRLVRDHFHELGLDPRSQVLDEGEARLLAAETASDLLDGEFTSNTPAAEAVRELIRRYGEGAAGRIENLVIAVHRHLQTLPDPAGWLDREEETWRRFGPDTWTALLVTEFRNVREGWVAQLTAQPADNLIAHRAAQGLRHLQEPVDRAGIAGVCGELAGYRAEEHWNRNKGKHRDPILNVLNDAALLASLAAAEAGGSDPLAVDFTLMQAHVLALIRLVREFGREFALRKRQRAGLDFSDLEQFSLRLLWNAGANAPTTVAQQLRGQLKAVLVDEYQDINEAQDRIIAAVSRETDGGNRFLVGDVKQSIYGFRLARPDIFLQYARRWRAPGAAGQVLPLSDNFRSHEAILEFVNRCFAVLLGPDMGELSYPAEAHLRFGDPAGRALLSRSSDPGPRVEICLRLTQPERAMRDATDSDEGSSDEELTNAELEATVAANRLRRLRESGVQVFDREKRALRPADWGDMAILLRATASKAAVYAQTFARAGIPLVAEQRGFFDAVEVSDLVSLLLLLDNPQQDIPLLAVLRSPLVGLSPDELVAIRVAAPTERSFWIALQRHQELRASAPAAVFQKVKWFLDSFRDWRERARRGSLSQCLEDILDATYYLSWLAGQPRGGQRTGNVQRLLELTRNYDAWQGRGLHRFLNYIRLLDEDREGPAPATPSVSDAVRLMTIHRSKGLEFPIVVLAGLSRPFQNDEPNAGFVMDEELGLCPEVVDVERRKQYASLRMLGARRRQRQRMIAEEIRLLYVAMTRACDHLILLGTTAENRAREQWFRRPDEPWSLRELGNARSPWDLIGPLMPTLCQRKDWWETPLGTSDVVTWRIIGSDERVKLTLNPPEGARPQLIRPTPDEIVATSRRVSCPYPFLEATRQAGKTTVTRIRRQLSERADDESAELYPTSGVSGNRTRTGRLSAAEVGSAYHKYFQKAGLEAVQTIDDLAREADRLVERGELTSVERSALQLTRVLDFWSGEVGRAILERKPEIHRELEFTAAFPARELAALASHTGPPAPGDDLVIVQGIVDLSVINPGEIWIIDYKTDQILASAVAGRATRYAPQVELYRRALTRIYARPVTRVWLHFLTPGVTFAMPGP